MGIIKYALALFTLCLCLCINSEINSTVDTKAVMPSPSDLSGSSTVIDEDEPIECNWETWQCQDDIFSTYPSASYNCNSTGVYTFSCARTCERDPPKLCNEHYCVEFRQICTVPQISSSPSTPAVSSLETSIVSAPTKPLYASTSPATTTKSSDKTTESPVKNTFECEQNSNWLRDGLLIYIAVMVTLLVGLWTVPLVKGDCTLCRTYNKLERNRIDHEGSENLACLSATGSPGATCPPVAPGAPAQAEIITMGTSPPTATENPLVTTSSPPTVDTVTSPSVEPAASSKSAVPGIPAAASVAQPAAVQPAAVQSTEGSSAKVPPAGLQTPKAADIRTSKRERVHSTGYEILNEETSIPLKAMSGGRKTVGNTNNCRLPSTKEGERKFRRSISEHMALLTTDSEEESADPNSDDVFNDSKLGTENLESQQTLSREEAKRLAKELRRQTSRRRSSAANIPIE